MSLARTRCLGVVYGSGVSIRSRTITKPKRSGAGHKRSTRAIKPTKPRTIAQLWRIIDRARGVTKPKGVSKAAIEKLTRALGLGRGRLPPELAASLAVHNGGVHLDSYDLLSTTEIARAGKRLSHAPFAADSGGNYYVVEHGGRLLNFEREDQRYYVKARSLAAWLESIVKRLTQGKLVAEAGAIVEKVLPPSVPSVPSTGQCIDSPLDDVVWQLIEHGDTTGVKKLVDAKTLEATARFGTDETLIANAAGAGQIEIVKLLLARGCPVDHGAERGARTALFSACWGMHAKPELVAHLLAHGADPNAQTRYDGTPLHSAIMWDHPELVRMLVAAGADPKRADAKGVTALAAAKKRKGDARAALLAALAKG